LFGIEISSDILIIAIFVQMAIITILIFTILTKLYKSNPDSTSASSKNTELDKKVDKKLTGMQIRLSEILSEISSATREQKESISNLAAAVAVAPAAPVVAPAATDPTVGEACTTDATAGVSTSVNTFPITENISSLTRMNQFATSDNANAAINSAISAKPSTFASELFDRSDDFPVSKSEFLDIDLDHGSTGNHNKEPDTLDSELHKVPKVVHASTHTSPDTSDTSEAIKSSDSSSHHHPISPADSRHYYHPQSHNHYNRRQYYDGLSSESSNLGKNIDDIFRGSGKNDNNGNEEDNLSQRQDFNKKGDPDPKKLIIPGEKNSNPELDKIDKEILIALQRLGGMDNSDDIENRNDAGS
jgi:hypothetical protein